MALPAHTHARALAIVLAFVASGCGDEFDSRTLLKGYRVLGVTSDPAEVRVGDVAQLTVHDIDTDGGEPTYEWSVCLYSFGAVVAFDCVDDSLELPLDAAGPTATLDLGPGGIDLVVFAAQANAIARTQVPDLDSDPIDLDAGHDIYLKLTSGPSGGRKIRSAHKLTVRLDDPETGRAGPRNHNPVIDAFTIDGEDADATAEVGGKVALALKLGAGSIETYDDEVRNEQAEEELVYTWFTTGGELDPPVTFGEGRESTLELPDEKGELTVFVTVRDGRGGLAVARHQIIVE